MHDIRYVAVNRIALWNKVPLVFAIRFQFLGAAGARRCSVDLSLVLSSPGNVLAN